MKYAWIVEQSDSYAVARLCRVLGVSRSGLLQWRSRPPSTRTLANAALGAEVATLHARSGRSYRRPRMLQALQAKGVKVSHERVRRSLRRQGLQSV